MERRKWDSKTKDIIVLQRLRGRPVVEICTEHEVSQTQYYQWRDQFMTNLPQVFSSNERREKALARENTRLKKIIDELTLEGKKQTSGKNKAS